MIVGLSLVPVPGRWPGKQITSTSWCGIYFTGSYKSGPPEWYQDTEFGRLSIHAGHMISPRFWTTDSGSQSITDLCI
jgi:hypothetical protein